MAGKKGVSEPFFNALKTTAKRWVFGNKYTHNDPAFNPHSHVVIEPYGNSLSLKKRVSKCRKGRLNHALAEEF